MIICIRDLQYILIRQYIDTANKYHDTILYIESIDISNFSSRTVNSDLYTQIESLSIYLYCKMECYKKPYKFACISAAVMAKIFFLKHSCYTLSIKNCTTKQ